jgi:hypothetical protein
VSFLAGISLPLEQIASSSNNNVLHATTEHASLDRADVQGTCKYGTRVDYILASPNSPYKFVPGSYAVVSSKGTSDHHIVKADITIGTAAAWGRRQRVVRMSNNGSSKGIWAAMQQLC